MLKTVRVKKKLRLDELIKYVIDKRVSDFQFKSDNNVGVYFSSNGYFLISGGKTGDGASRSIQLVDTFTVEVEEKIDNTTIFKSVVGVLKDDRIMLTNTYTTIEDIQDKYGSMKEIHAVIDGKLQLVWEADEDVN